MVWGHLFRYLQRYSQQENQIAQRPAASRYPVDAGSLVIPRIRRFGDVKSYLFRGFWNFDPYPHRPAWFALTSTLSIRRFYGVYTPFGNVTCLWKVAHLVRWFTHSMAIFHSKLFVYRREPHWWVEQLNPQQSADCFGEAKFEALKEEKAEIESGHLANGGAMAGNHRKWWVEWVGLRLKGTQDTIGFICFIYHQYTISYRGFLQTSPWKQLWEYCKQPKAGMFTNNKWEFHNEKPGLLHWCNLKLVHCLVIVSSTRILVGQYPLIPPFW